MGNVSSDKTIDGTTPVSEPQGQLGYISFGKLSTKFPAASSDQPARNVRPGYTERYGNAPLNMGNMSYALPGHPQYDQMQYPAHGQGMMYMPMPYGPGPSPGVPYGVPYPYPPYSIQHPSHASHYQSYANQPMQNMPQSSPYAGYYPYANYAHPPGPMHQAGPPVGRAQTNSPSKPPALRKEAEKQIAQLEYDVSKTIVDGSNPMKSVPAQPPHSGECLLPPTKRSFANAHVLPDTSTPSHFTPTAPSTPRGPPRKPKQSGHALWVGNLPPGASVMDLKDHFSQDATHDIESVFLISKSNCAFVNYKSEAACVAALARFHDSRFQGVRVVCRLRKGLTAPGSGTGYGPGSVGVAGQSNPRLREDVASTATATATTTATVADPGPVLGDITPEAAPATGHHPPPARVVDRYFIVKSLTTEDLEMSKQSGIWATQSHNEAAINQAYEVSVVLLVFWFFEAHYPVLT
jgi:hypothetical protein